MTSNDKKEGKNVTSQAAEASDFNVGIKNFRHGTNIMDVRLPVQLERLVPTGVDWFDKACGSDGETSGVTPSFVTLFTGLPGAGKTTLALQLAEGITANGNTCLYNTGEESLYQVRKAVKRLDLKEGFIAGQDVLTERLFAHADKLIEANRIEAQQTKRRQKQLFIIVDSLKTMDDGKYKNGTNSMTAVRVMKQLAEYAKATYAIIIVIGHVTKSGQFEGKQAVKHFADGHCHLDLDMNSKSSTYGKRIFKFTKNRFGALNIMGTVLDMTSTGLVQVGMQDGDYQEDE